MKRGTTLKSVLKGVHKCTEKCKASSDGSETHFEMINGEEISFCIKVSTSLKASDPEMWELTHTENIHKARQKAAAAANDKRVEQGVEGYKNLKEAFELFDADGSGYLDDAEMLQILTRASGGTALDEKDAKEFIAIFDHNKDGKMQYTEFIEAMKTLAEASGLWEGHDSAADEVVEAVVEDYGLAMLTKMDEDQVSKLQEAKEKVQRAKGAGVGKKAAATKAVIASAKAAAMTSAAASQEAADPEAEAAAECNVDGLREIMEGLSIQDHLGTATEWCNDVGIESLAELKEMEMEADLVSYLVDLKPAKAKLMLKRIQAL